MDFDTIDIIILLPIFYFNIGDFYTKKIMERVLIYSRE